VATDRRNVLIVDDHGPTRLLVGRIVTRELGARVTLAKPVDREPITTMLRSLLAPKRAGHDGANATPDNGC